MPRLLTMNNKPLPNQLTLVAGSPYAFKVSGLGPDKRHVVLMSSSPMVKVVVVNANDRNVEQTLRMEPAASVPAPTPATISAYLASKPTQKDGSTGILAVTIEPKIDLPAAGTEAGIVTRMFLAEAVAPGSPNFVAAESKEAMQWMRHVMLNRIKLGAQYFGASKDATTLTAMITGANQVEGFQHYPNIARGQAAVIDGVVRLANTSGHKDVLLYRQFIRDAINIASGADPGKDPSPTGLFSWRTAKAASPGSNFVKYRTHGGQDFYTLTDAFRKDPLQRKK
jgi:hypothetical protein